MGFERCHPAVNFLFFTVVMVTTLVFRQPVFLCIGVFSAFLYSIYRSARQALQLSALLLAGSFLFVLYYVSYHHFGVSVLFYSTIGNRITLEAILCGIAVAAGISGACMWLFCVCSVITADKVVYLFGKAFPRLGLFFAVTLRMLPRLKQEASRIHTARRGIGRGVGQGSMPARLKNAVAIFSALITWTIEALKTASNSMRSRGSTLRGRTAFSIYRWDHRDQAFLVAMFLCITLTGMGRLLHQMDMSFDPRVILPPVTGMSYLFYIGYGCFCLLPLGLEIGTRLQFERARKHI